jgi:hypothetical protein
LKNNDEKPLSETFGVLEELKKSYHTNIEDYIISEMSLKEIFLSVAEEKEEENHVQV